MTRGASDLDGVEIVTHLRVKGPSAGAVVAGRRFDAETTDLPLAALTGDEIDAILADSRLDAVMR